MSRIENCQKMHFLNCHLPRQVCLIEDRLRRTPPIETLIDLQKIILPNRLCQPKLLWPAQTEDWIRRELTLPGQINNSFAHQLCFIGLCEDCQSKTFFSDIWVLLWTFATLCKGEAGQQQDFLLEEISFCSISNPLWAGILSHPNLACFEDSRLCTSWAAPRQEFLLEEIFFCSISNPLRFNFSADFSCWSLFALVCRQLKFLKFFIAREGFPGVKSYLFLEKF